MDIFVALPFQSKRQRSLETQKKKNIINFYNKIFVKFLKQ